MNLQRISYQNPDLTGRIRAGLLQLKAAVKISAETEAQLNLPGLTQDQMSLYWREHHQGFQGLLNQINQELKVDTTRYQVQQTDQAAAREEQKLINRTRELKDELAPVEAKLKTMPEPEKKKTEKLIWVATLVIALFEAGFSLPAFSGWGLGYLEALVASLLFCGFLIVYVMVIPRMVAAGKTLFWKWVISVGISILTLAVFTGMGYMRAEYLEAQARESGSNVEIAVWPLVVFSTLLFVIAVCLHEFFMPQKAVRQYAREHDELIQKRDHLKTGIERLNDQILSNNAAKENFKVESAGMIELGYMLEEEVMEAARGTYELYKIVNLSHRQGRPDCFDQPYPFEFIRYFNFKPLSHEIH